ncbi:hypothetical protein GN244_ATG06034 [Phytophthora infestans]|uniref:Uncharacterized protein n=1 Tax=Phytophthora infestans TaxID=4787 RepID=A0A833SW50_PHYIN|nr:hypothetical protein GN244_ATG06034 [Phytophthora infestans]
MYPTVLFCQMGTLSRRRVATAMKEAMKRLLATHLEKASGWGTLKGTRNRRREDCVLSGHAV